MSIRRMGAVLALSTMAIVGTATAAAARDYPPTTGSVSTEAANVTTPSSAATVVTEGSASNSSGSLPFTGGNDVQLVWIGAACAGAGALAVVKTRRNHRRA